MIYLKKLYIMCALTLVSLCALVHCCSMLLIGANAFPAMIDEFVDLWSEEFGK